MSMQNHFDGIIIGTGAGGGTLAHKLAPTGKRIFLLSPWPRRRWLLRTAKSLKKLAND